MEVWAFIFFTGTCASIGTGKFEQMKCPKKYIKKFVNQILFGVWNSGCVCTMPFRVSKVVKIKLSLGNSVGI